MAEARRQYPDVYRDYVGSGFTKAFGLPKMPRQRGKKWRPPRRPIGEGRGVHPHEPRVQKFAPTSFEDLVVVEMAKGCNQEVASQRVVQQYGVAALRHRAISKRAADIEDTFAKRAEDILASEDVDRCEALRKARRENPHLYAALQTI